MKRKIETLSKCFSIIAVFVFAAVMNFNLSFYSSSSDLSLDALKVQVAHASGEDGTGRHTCYATSDSGGNTDTTRCNTCTDWEGRENLRDQGTC